MKSIFQGHKLYPGKIKRRSGLGFEPKLYRFSIHVNCRAVVSAEPFDSIGVHLNSASFDSPADQLNKLAEKSKEINPDFS